MTAFYSILNSLDFDLPNFLKNYGALIAWVFVVAGWLISNRQANNREKRKEYRAEIDAIEKQVRVVLDSLGKYFLLKNGSPESQNLELQIKVLFRDIDLRRERLEKRKNSTSVTKFINDSNNAFESFFDLATGHYFESSETIDPKLVDQHIHELNIFALVAVESLHSLFLKKFDDI